MASIESLLFQAQQRGDMQEVKRLTRLLERLDDQRVTYGRTQRGETNHGY
jgi:hypothetical protein